MSEDDYKVCPTCKKLKDKKEDFGQNLRCDDGYFLNCKSCRKKRNKVLCQKWKGKFYQRDNHKLYLRYPNENEYRHTYKFLQSIGYNLNEDIYIQFHKKYGFEIPEKEVDKKFHLTPKDLNMI